MPVVLFSRTPNQLRMPKVDQTFLMAAAADLDQAGMLFEPEHVPEGSIDHDEDDIRDSNEPVKLRKTPTADDYPEPGKPTRVEVG